MTKATKPIPNAKKTPEQLELTRRNNPALVEKIEDDDLWRVPFSVDPHLLWRVQKLRKRLKKDFDACWIVTGKERTGKSVLAAQIAKMVDPTFNLSRVCMDEKEFHKAVVEAPPGSAVVFDEALRGFLSRDAMSSINKLLVRLLAEIGQKNLFLIIAMPSFFYLDSYMALHRTSAVIRVYTHGTRRGYFKFYNSRKKKEIFLMGKQKQHYYVKPNFSGTFTNYYVVDEAEYRKKKDESFKKMIENSEKQPGTKWETARKKSVLGMIKVMKEDLHLSYGKANRMYKARTGKNIDKHEWAGEETDE